MNTFQKMGSALVASVVLNGCDLPPSVKMEGDPSNPKSVQLDFQRGKVYANCVNNILDAKGFGGWTHEQKVIHIPVQNCTLETVKNTLMHYGMDDIGKLVPHIKK